MVDSHEFDDIVKNIKKELPENIELLAVEKVDNAIMFQIDNNLSLGKFGNRLNQVSTKIYQTYNENKNIEEETSPIDHNEILAEDNDIIFKVVLK